MPDNELEGILEDFVAFLVPTGDSLWPYAKECVQQIPDRRFGLHQQSKADIHTWLAWQAEPGRPLGLAIQSRYLDPNAPHAQKLVGWLRRLFEI
jgi:hypothetical protein